MKLNKNIEILLNKNNSFSKASAFINDYKNQHKEINFIDLGVGNMSTPVPKEVTDAIKTACDNMCSTYIGFSGLLQLREKIKEKIYPNFSTDEIYISDGTKGTITDLLELFDKQSTIYIQEPNYPIYKNSLIIKDYNFTIGEELIPNQHYDILIICSPNNPRGDALSENEIDKIIEYCKQNNSIIILDNAYWAYDNAASSVYINPEASKYFIEVRTFSKEISFAGLRCGYYVIPDAICENINKYWKERGINRFNGASYLSQIGAYAYLNSDSTQQSVKNNIKRMMDNTLYLKKILLDLDVPFLLDTSAPYIWAKMDFHQLLSLGIITIPGDVFGDKYKDYVRIACFASDDDIKETGRRLKSVKK